MTHEEFIEHCKNKYKPFVGEAGVMVGNYMFTLDGRISIQIGGYDKNNPCSVWVCLAKKRTPQQMADFLRSVM